MCGMNTNEQEMYSQRDMQERHFLWKFCGGLLSPMRKKMCIMMKDQEDGSLD